MIKTVKDSSLLKESVNETIEKNQNNEKVTISIRKYIKREQSYPSE